LAITWASTPAIIEHFGSPRQLSSGREFPDLPGVYIWSSNRRVMYVGMGSSLTIRLGYEQFEVDAHDPVENWHYSVIHMLRLHGATVEWITTADTEEALELERRLIEWHRTCVGMASLVVGWESKEGSRRQRSEEWARDLWKRLFGQQGSRAW
jgi:hypothetical protein